MHPDLKPPRLIVPSGKRVRSGRLMSDELIDLTRQYQAAAVILWDEKLASFSEYVDWLQVEYHHVAQMGDDHDVYVPRQIDPAITFPVRARFGDAIDLLGYSFDAPTARPETEYPVRLYWQAVDVPTAAYGYNLRLMRDGREWWRWDSRPQAAMRETTEWSAGEVVPDALPIDIQPATPPGTYQLELRVYDSETGAGLPIHQPDTQVLPGEWLPLGPLEVRP